MRASFTRILGIFVPIYDYAGKVDLKQVLLKSRKKIGGNHAFFKDNS